MKVKSKYACKFMFVLIFNRRFDRLKKFKLNKITLSSNLRRKIYYAYGHFWCFFLVWFFFVVFSCGVFMWVFFFWQSEPDILSMCRETNIVFNYWISLRQQSTYQTFKHTKDDNLYKLSNGLSYLKRNKEYIFFRFQNSTFYKK